MKLVYAGTPEIAVAPLRAILSAGHEVAAVLTQPDKPQGRKGILTPSLVKRAAEEAGIPVLQPDKLKNDFAALAAVKADCMVTCAYGQILTREILDLFPRGVWNIHASLLPEYRGAAPIPRVIIDGKKRTGVTIMRTDEGIDTGDMLLCRALDILPSDTCGTLSEKLSALGAALIVEALDCISRGEENLVKQGEGFVCRKVERTRVDFSKSAEEASALVLGLSPAPLAFGVVNGLTLNFFFAEAVPYAGEEPYGTVVTENPKEGLLVTCGKGAVRITELQPAGGKRMSARDFLNGRKITKGMRFEDQSLL